MCRWLKVILVNSPSHESAEITYTNLFNSSSLISNSNSIRLWISMDTFNKLDTWTRTMNQTFKKVLKLSISNRVFFKIHPRDLRKKGKCDAQSKCSFLSWVIKLSLKFHKFWEKWLRGMASTWMGTSMCYYCKMCWMNNCRADTRWDHSCLRLEGITTRKDFLTNN